MRKYINEFKILVKKIQIGSDVKDFFVLSLIYILLSASSFISVVLISNHLDKNEFGIYRFALSILPILVIFTLPGLALAVHKYASQNKCIDFFHALKAKVMYGTTATFVAVLFAIFFLTNNQQKYAIAALILAIFVPFYELFFVYNHFLRGKKEYKKILLYELLSNSIKLVIIWLFTISPSKSPFVLLVVVLLTKNILDIIFFIYTYRKFNLANCIEKSKENTLELIKEAKKISINYSYLAVANNLDKVIIGILFSPSTLAVYSVLNTITNQINGLLNQSINQILFLKVIHNNNKLVLNKTIFWLAVALLIFLTSAYAIFYIAFPILFSKYKEYTLLIFTTIPVVISTAILNSIWFVYIAKNQHYKLNVLQNIRIMSFITLMFIFYINEYTHNTTNAIIYTSCALACANLFAILSILVYKKNKAT